MKVMTEDPIQILREVGIDPVDFVLVAENLKPQRIIDRREDCAMCALQRIARLAVKYKWQRDRAVGDLASDYETIRTTAQEWNADYLADLEARWEARDD